MIGRTVDQALDRFRLVDGIGDGQRTACAMSLLAWVHGDDGWTDSPDCAHRLIRSLVVRVNDAAGTTAEVRARIVRAGELGVLDTWWIPATVILRAVAEARGIAPEGSDVDQLVAMLDLIALWKAGDRGPSSADLWGADLSGADLSDANLWGANLRGANLWGANLWGADLRGANLSGADLSDANLRGANLRGANLRGANLSDADLSDADLSGANLRASDAPIPGWVLVDGRLTREAAS